MQNVLRKYTQNCGTFKTFSLIKFLKYNENLLEQNNHLLFVWFGKILTLRMISSLVLLQFFVSVRFDVRNKTDTSFNLFSVCTDLSTAWRAERKSECKEDQEDERSLECTQTMDIRPTNDL